MASEAEYRLPRIVVPSHYDIVIEPDLAAASFVGSVRIALDIVEPTSIIELHAIELDLRSVTVSQGGTDHRASVVLDEDSETAKLIFEGELSSGNAVLFIEFTGILNDDLRGFYRSVFTDDDGIEHTIATTQFEATDARRAFPCWDEPDFKATFRTTLIVEEGLFAVTNAAEIGRTVLDSGKVEVRFDTTMKMSTYLVAFVVGHLVATDPVDVDGVPLRIIAPPGNEHLTDFALDMGAHALRFFSDYYDIPYPGDKLDMVAIPDFAFGAMENLGCITYRETALLLNPETATQSELTRVADVIAHEIAHMWFGDLVTMKWWNGIWLNEAFATFAEIKCVDAYKPEWNRWLSFSAMRAISQEIDALASTRPIEFEVKSPSDANAMFDVLTYQKGSSVLRMLEQYIGEETFRTGINAYLKKHAYGNTDTPDLWAALEEASHEPVGQIMDTWILQGGYPRLIVEREAGNFCLSQEHFRLIGEGDGTWQIPVLYASSDGHGKTIVGEKPITLKAADDFIANAGGEGFFRVGYSEELLPGIIERLPELDPIERYGIVSDAYAAVVKGDTPASSYLELVAGLKDEDEVDVWSIALAGISALDRVIATDDRSAMQQYVRHVVSGKVQELGWTVGGDESDRRRQMRGLLLRTLGNLGADRDAIDTATRMYRSDEPVDAEVADAALMIVAANSDVVLFDELIDKSKNATNPQHTVKYLRAATQVLDPTAAERMFHMVLDGQIRTQDSFWVLALLIGHRENGPMIWKLIEENWDTVIDTMPHANKRGFIHQIPHRSEPDVAASIEAWFEDHEIPGGARAIAQELELLRANVELRKREENRMGNAIRRLLTSDF
ncbi:MAG: M1 family metallopeptidase [Acidimicrobiia bacterium]|nr:M1 family metallopeptidase [Acidimicrobiia bacterium]